MSDLHGEVKNSSGRQRKSPAFENRAKTGAASVKSRVCRKAPAGRREPTYGWTWIILPLASSVPCTLTFLPSNFWTSLWWSMS